MQANIVARQLQIMPAVDRRSGHVEPSEKVGMDTGNPVVFDIAPK